MSVDVDPLASLRPWSFVVDLAGEEYAIEARSADRWLQVLMPNPMDVADILPGMLSDADQERLEEKLLDGEVSASELRDTALEIITVAGGRDWWWTLNLVQTAASVWLIVGGHLIAQGLQFDRLSLGAVLDAMYSTIAARLDKDRLRTFNSDLARPPAGMAPELKEEDEAAQFLALMNSM